MFIVGLTGGIASGKSTVAGRLAQYGAVVIDADQVARDVVEPGTPGFEAVVAEFGPAVLQPDGSLDRRALGEIVFSDRGRLEALNAIVHPLVKAETERRFATQPPDAVVVYDVPLLVDVDVKHAYDLIVVVSADPEERVRRLTENRGIPVDQARARVAAQVSEAERNDAADIVIDSGGSIDETLRQADSVWSTVTRRAAAKRHRSRIG